MIRPENEFNADKPGEAPAECPVAKDVAGATDRLHIAITGPPDNLTAFPATDLVILFVVVVVISGIWKISAVLGRSYLNPCAQVISVRRQCGACHERRESSGEKKRFTHLILT